jgi:hypothetical protein
MMAVLLVALAAPGWSQQTQATGQAAAQAAGQASAEAGKNAAAAVRSGTKINAELESTVDTRNAKPGDEVVARVTKKVKQDGKTVVRKGDRLLGRVQSVRADAEGKAGSSMSVVFDRLVSGEATSELHTVVSAVLSTPRERAEQQARLAEPMPAPAPATAGGGGSGGGLVGGVTSTVGSTVGSTASAAGGVVGGVGSTVGATTQSTLGATSGALLSTPARAIRIDSQAQAENQTSANSVLSTRQGHLRLESGTQMQFRVAGEADAGKKQQAKQQGSSQEKPQRDGGKQTP